MYKGTSVLCTNDERFTTSEASSHPRSPPGPVSVRPWLENPRVVNSHMAHFGVIGRSQSPRATQVSLQRPLGARWAPHLAHVLASHEGDRSASFKNRHPMVGEPNSSGSRSSPVRSEIRGVGRSQAVVAARTGPDNPWDGRNRETVAISGESVEASRNGDHRRQPYDHKKSRSHPG
jgi:hypothetical protein